MIPTHDALVEGASDVLVILLEDLIGNLLLGELLVNEISLSHASEGWTLGSLDTRETR